MVEDINRPTTTSTVATWVSKENSHYCSLLHLKFIIDTQIMLYIPFSAHQYIMF
jgi:hypothetical protein